jgi:U3 small nucleolar RNA-associated protein 4
LFVGLDTNLVIAPLKRHGDQYQYTISGLPQVPAMTYTQGPRLVVCWWEREVSIWRIKPGRDSKEKRHELKARIAIQGEENITSVSISSNGRQIAVATSAEVKLFELIYRPAQEEQYQIRKLRNLGSTGARLVQYSPNSKWLAIIASTNEVSIFQGLNKTKSIQSHHLKRQTHSPISDPALGEYLNMINRIEFSPDSDMLVVSDLRGNVDSWIFNTTASSNDTMEVDEKEAIQEDSSDDSDSEDESSSNGWTSNRVNCPKLESSVIALTFRPSEEPDETHNLVVVTAKHRIREINMDTGYFTEWSKRNPNSVLPEAFKMIKDRTMGTFWGAKGWLWLYGSSWMFGFNTTVDLREPEQVAHSNDDAPPSKKRKRDSSGGYTKKERGGLVLDPDCEPQEDDSDFDDGDSEESDIDDFADAIRGGREMTESGRKGKAKWYLTHRYRPVLGIVPVQDAKPDAEGTVLEVPEVVLVERPIWCLDLPGRYENEHS